MDTGGIVSGDPQQVLSETFGLDGFRAGQQAVINRLLAGKNVAAVFPTGGGKSLCYQLPSQMFSGTTVVVSPLIALMKDQCDALAEKGVRATRLDSSLSAQRYSDAMRGIRDGSIKLLYVSPERFFNERFLASIGTLDVSLFAIDEAHCISQWGHNFRPDYLKLAALANDLSASRVLALTATATPNVLSDICAAFDIDEGDAIRTEFFRSNLILRSQVMDEDQYDLLLERLRQRPQGSTLVYVSRQKTAEQIAARLTEDGFSATAYHAGMDAQRRSEVQQEFIRQSSGVVVATIAFGMGIDKSDIRYVYHFNPPKSLEAYAQEVGRAGRDGQEAICEMLLVPGDRVVLENYAYGDTPTRHAVGRLVDLLAGQPDSFFVSQYKLSTETDIRLLVIRTLLTYLELEGFLKATSPRYDSYKIKPLVTSKAILDHFQGERREFIAGLLGCLTKGRTWFTLDVVMAVKRLGVQRERIIKAIDYMSEQQWLEVQVSDLVHGYRWLQRMEQPKLVADDLHDRLIRREQSEINRLDEVFQLAVAENCQAEQLSAHFGESLARPCGQCTACTGDGPFVIDSPQQQSIGTSARTYIDRLAREYPDHFVTARDRARFLCGLASPSFVRAKLTRDPYFGVCDVIRFADVLAQVE